MEAEEFVKQLKSLIPSREDFSSINLPEDEAFRTIDALSPVEKKSKNEFIEINPIIELVERYDLSKVEIGLITFNNLIKRNSNYTFFGLLEGVDNLVINNKSKVIQVLQGGTDNHLLWQCAKDGEAFLDALIICSSFLTNCLFDDNLWDDKEKIFDSVKKASNAAGGKEFLDFYKMLLGYF